MAAGAKLRADCDLRAARPAAKAWRQVVRALGAMRRRGQLPDGHSRRQGLSA